MRTVLTALGLTMVLTACNSAEPPAEPPQLTTPPEVATSGFLTAYVEETIPMEVAELRVYSEEDPLIGYLQPTENIANPVASQVLDGTWPEPGAVRWLRLADGHYVVERVLENELDFFKYQIFVFTNDTGRGVEQIVGEQRFVSVDEGTRFEWTYNVLPHNLVTRQIVRGNMDEIEAYIGSGLEGFAAAAAARAAAGREAEG
ncbi:MAG: hypothetical protein AAGE18_06095 [Pseudomonadota bacterium]